MTFKFHLLPAGNSFKFGYFSNKYPTSRVNGLLLKSAEDKEYLIAW